MKTFLLLPLVLAVPAFAGTATSSKEVVAPPAESCVLTWFAGASVGYLTEFEEPMYNLHVGVTNNCWKLAGWDISAFAEVGYTQKDESYDIDRYQPISTTHALYPYGITGYDVEVDIIPITLNVKFERAITGNLFGYLGAGLGAAYVDADVNVKGVGPNKNFSDSDWVFTAQVFGGLMYKVNPHFEVYGGARWIYISDPSFDTDLGSGSVDVSDDCLLELGARYKF